MDKGRFIVEPNMSADIMLLKRRRASKVAKRTAEVAKMKIEIAALNTSRKEWEEEELTRRKEKIAAIKYREEREKVVTPPPVPKENVWDRMFNKVFF